MLYKRKITEEIKKLLFKKEIIILNGSRQVGKTSLLKLLTDELKKSGVLEKNIFYLNLEEIKIIDALNQDPENLLKYIIASDEINYFFLDEIQYLDNPSNFLKHLYDKYAGKIKIIATGSSSLELKAKIQDSLVGRKMSFWINPLTFEEFLFFKDFSYFDYLEKTDLPPNIKTVFDSALEEYLIYGGMPAVVLEKDLTLKKKMLEEYVNDYINKDIRAIGKIENIARFNIAIKMLASQIGNLLNISELANTADISRREAEKYLDLLEFTFVLDKISPYKKNIRSQLVKMPKVYFFDLGIRNAILGNFLNANSRQDSGFLFENFVFLELKNKMKNKIFFYRATSKAEIDFIIDKGEKIVLIEAKYKNLTKPIDSRTIESFASRAGNVDKSAVVNLSFNSKDNLIEYADYRFASKMVLQA
jgi:uncharacterized protein